MADFTQWKELLNLLHTQATSSKPATSEEALNHIASVSAAVLDGLRPVLSSTAASSLSSSASTTVGGDGTSSEQQQRLFSLLLSTGKMVNAGAFTDVDYEDAQHADDWCRAVADTAAAMLGAQPCSSVSGDKQQHSTDTGSSSTADSTQQHTAGGSSDSALSMLPWLVLFGRCCLRWHQALQKAEPGAWFIPQGAPRWPPPAQKAGVDWWRMLDGKDVFVLQQVQPTKTGSADAAGDRSAADQDSEGEDEAHPAAVPRPAQPPKVPREQPQFAAWLSTITAWLQDSTTSAQLQAAGLSTEPLLQRLQATADALARLQHLGSVNAMDLMFTGFTLSLDGQTGPMAGQNKHDADKQLGVAFVQQLYPLGMALCALPLSCGCNNPSCVTLEGVAEGDTGAAGMNRCAGCRMVRYCSKQCQAQHWKQHKPVCKALAAAAAAAAK